jgi:hypothetical protein
MRCLYCGKELALLKRLTGGGDFCSDAHKQSYQEEYNRLALGRLLQAQKKGQQTGHLAAQDAAPPPSALVAVEEDEPVREAEDPVLEVALTETLTRTLPDASSDGAVEESSSEAVEDREASVSEEPEPLEMAGFLFDSPAPALAAPPDETPYLESWLELSAGPAMSEWQLQNGASFSLLPADLLTLELRPNASSIEERALSDGLLPQAIVGAQLDPKLAAMTDAKQPANINRLPASASVAVDIPPTTAPSAVGPSFVQFIGFDCTVLVADSQLLELSPTTIDFPAEDSDVVVVVGGGFSAKAAPETAEEDNSPRASLEALSRLHQELVEQEPATEKASDHPEIPEPAAEEPKSPEEETTVQPPEEALKPKFATELFEISMRTFPPAKPALIGGEAFPNQNAPLLPHLTSLPVRPKVALATGYVPASILPAPTETKPSLPAASAAPTQRPSKAAAAASSKPTARLTQPKQPTPSAKLVQGPPAKPVAKSVPGKSTAVEEAPAPAAIPEAAPKVPAAEKEPASKPAPTANGGAPAAEKPKPVAEKQKPAADKPKSAEDKSKPATETPKPAVVQAKPKVDQPNADQPKKDSVPNFGVAQPGNASFLGSLKVKLGIAIVLLVIACVYFLGWGGGKSHKPAGSNAAVSSDGTGPSIIMGEGGWVEGWGGDPNGLHVGRQITIYRPSLKLSDYRLEFQGSIDAKSVGWVFRASDPENYYAMKLMTVSSGLSPKVALFKYLVANGKQTQVGRVPIDIAVHPDTVFAVRVDVRGPQFTTYLQGQQVDSWTDDQLKVGGAGFLNEREERGKVKSVSIRYLSGAASK